MYYQFYAYLKFVANHFATIRLLYGIYKAHFLQNLEILMKYVNLENLVGRRIVEFAIVQIIVLFLKEASSNT